MLRVTETLCDLYAVCLLSLGSLSREDGNGNDDARKQ